MVSRINGVERETHVGTLIHELAHVVVYLRYGAVPPHGRHFRTLMRAVNLSAKATHDLPVAHLRRQRRRRPRQKYLYLHRCDECGYSFVARSIRRGYYCTACGPTMNWDVFRTPDTADGRKRLKTVTAQK